MRHKVVMITAILLAICFSQTTYKNDAQVRMAPRMLNYQGYLTDYQGIPLNQPAVSFTFTIFDAESGGNQLWTETQYDIPVSKGIFNVLLGSITPIPDSIFTKGTTRWLQLQVYSQILEPRTRIASSPYSYTSTFADTAAYAYSAKADTDWIFSGNNIYSSVSGNVGIGITNPAAKLTVNSSGANYGDGIRLTNGSNWWECVHDGQFGLTFGYNGSNQFVINRAGYSFFTAGNLGVGTTTPELKLDVAGAIKTSTATIEGGYLSICNTLKIGAIVNNWSIFNMTGVYGDALKFWRYYQDGTNAGPSFTLWDNGNAYFLGNVGIGQAYPRYPLDVIGVICGGTGDTVNAMYGGILSGYSNLAGDAASDSGATVAGGINNSAVDRYSFVGGGNNNTANYRATVGGGVANAATGDCAVVGGGIFNVASGSFTSVGGGRADTAKSYYATVSGGYWNVAGGFCATVPGGNFNNAAGNYSFAAGRYAKAYNNGCFVWGDTTLAMLITSVDNQWLARCCGGVYFYTNSLLSSGSYLAAGGSSWSSLSDRNSKENFQPVDGGDVLSKLVAMPITTWNYKSQDKSIRHIGPMSQDFATFGVGEDNKHITTIDADGIALVAIQELAKQVQELKAENKELRAEIEILKDR